MVLKDEGEESCELYVGPVTVWLVFVFSYLVLLGRGVLKIFSAFLINSEKGCHPLYVVADHRPSTMTIDTTV